MGHWISEEPFELSNYFPAAPVSQMLFYYGKYNLEFSGNYYLHRYRLKFLLSQNQVCSQLKTHFIDLS